MIPTDQHLLIGKINGIFGIKGWVKVFSYCDPIENICTYSPWVIEHKGSLSSVEVRSKRQGKTIIAKLPHIHTPEEARTVLGTDIYIQHSQLPPLEDSYYYFQLEGLEVIGLDNHHFGRVAYTFDTGSNSVIVVKHPDTKAEYYIPLIEPYLVTIDVTTKRITVDWDKDF